MIKDISGIPLIILLCAGAIDCTLIFFAFRYFIKNAKKELE